MRGLPASVAWGGNTSATEWPRPTQTWFAAFCNWNETVLCPRVYSEQFENVKNKTLHQTGLWKELHVWRGSAVTTLQSVFLRWREGFHCDPQKTRRKITAIKDRYQRAMGEPQDSDFLAKLPKVGHWGNDAGWYRLPCGNSFSLIQNFSGWTGSPTRTRYVSQLAMQLILSVLGLNPTSHDIKVMAGNSKGMKKGFPFKTNHIQIQHLAYYTTNVTHINM